MVGLACGNEVGEDMEQVAVAGVEEVCFLEVAGDVPGLGCVAGVQECAEQGGFGVEFRDGGGGVGGGEVVDVDRVAFVPRYLASAGYVW